MSCIEVGVSGRSFCRLTETWSILFGGKDARAVVASTAPTTRGRPRGGPDHLPEEYRCRFSFCCGRDGCRKEDDAATGPFLAGKVYLGAVAVWTAMRQGPTPRRVHELSTLFAVDRATVVRWQAFWRDYIPQTPFWKLARCRVGQSLKSSFCLCRCWKCSIAPKIPPRTGGIACDFCRRLRSRAVR